MVTAESERKVSKELYERQFLTESIPGSGGCSECRHVEDKLKQAVKTLLYIGDAAATFKTSPEWAYATKHCLEEIQKTAYNTAFDLDVR